MAYRTNKQKSEYGQQLEEKQGLKNTYALREKQFRRYFDKGSDPETIMRSLERRLDNVVFRCGLAPTRKAARQLVSHGHIQVNGRKVRVSSLQVKINDAISIRAGSAKITPFQDLSSILKKYEPPAWIALDKAKLEAKIIGQPTIDDPIIAASIKPIIGFYSR